MASLTFGKYNDITMNFNVLHDFHLTPAAAIALQTELALNVEAVDVSAKVELIAGVDVAAGRQGTIGRAAIVVVQYPSLEIVAESVYQGVTVMPYIPGLLSFRELPLIIPALEKLALTPDLFLVDGHGIAHPRRLGIASHLGLITGIPTVGCAKSRLCGEHKEIATVKGSSTDLLDDNEITGRVLRTKSCCKPLYISVGHKITLETAVAWVLKLDRGYRLPEPVRLAHKTAGEYCQAG
ncbi:endonuclease V [Dehalogenimonas sp. WBC-2]|nr:endonuclease V [Dehalogenimonas sp. WBC-2]